MGACGRRKGVLDLKSPPVDGEGEGKRNDRLIESVYGSGDWLMGGVLAGQEAWTVNLWMQASDRRVRGMVVRGKGMEKKCEQYCSLRIERVCRAFVSGCHWVWVDVEKSCSKTMELKYSKQESHLHRIVPMKSHHLE